jgi:hypothetical protein
LLSRAIWDEDVVPTNIGRRLHFTRAALPHSGPRRKWFPQTGPLLGGRRATVLRPDRVRGKLPDGRLSR